MQNQRRASRGSRLVAAAIGLALAGAAHGQETPPAPASTGGLEEIIVTGTKRFESSQDVPIAISAISETALQNAHVNDVRALQNLAPKILAGDFAPGFMVDTQQKDMRLVAEAAERANVALPGSALVTQLWRSAQAHGSGAEGIHALDKVLRRLSGK